MADNIAISAGTGTTVATDQVGSAHYQKIKVYDGTADSENGLVVDSSGNAMVKLAAGTAAIGKLAANSGVDIGDVDILSIGAGDNNIGNVDVATIAAGDNNIGNVDIASAIPAGSNLIGKVSIDQVSANANEVVTKTGSVTTATLAAETTKVIGTVNVAANQTIAVTNAGTFATQATLQAGTAAIGKLAANSGVDIGDVDVLSLPALAAGTNAIGKLLPSDIDITAHTNYAKKYYTSTGAATDGIIWSPAAGKRWHVTSLYFQVSADATVTFEDDKAGGDDPVLKGEYKAGSGVALTFDEKYPFASGEDAADLTVTTSAGNIYVSVVGYEV